MLRGILTVGGWTIVSRFMGFGRDMLIAAIIGAGPVADAFFVANRLPNLFRRLFGEGAFNAAFVPSFAALLHTDGKEAAQRFAEQASAVLAFWLVSLTILGEIFMPQLMAVLAPGFRSDPAKFALAVELARIAFPYMPLICLVALLSGVLNGLDHFAAAAAAPLLYNVSSIGFMLGLLHVLPTPGHALAVGVSVSGIFQLAMVGYAVRRAGMRLHLPRPRLTPQMRRLLRRMGPGLLGAGVTQLNLSVDVIIGTLLPPGTVAVLYYADRVNQLPLGILGAAVGTALLPTLSRDVHSDDPSRAIGSLNRAIEYALVLTLPASLGLLVAAHPIIAVLFGRGAFDPHSVALSARALQAYAFGLPAFVATRVMVVPFFARGDTKTPVRVGLGCVALNLALNIAFMHPLQEMGPALAAAVAGWANVLQLGWILLKRGHFAADRLMVRRVIGMACAAVAMAGALLVIQAIHPPMLETGARRAIGLAILIGGGVAAYGIAGQLLGAFDMSALLRRALLRRAKRV